ncbi:MAG: ankyrin repeat domain-containing protein [Candidatus Coatesbacteria bacterium]|nr:ankyrin repeat domain-containing protein [Candidatus Coatesbacteria bacterium]
MNKQDKDLLDGAEKGDLKKVREAIEEGANIAAINSYGSNALILAASRDHYEVAKYLVEKGCYVNVKQKHGWTPLMFASENGNKNIAELLLNNGAEIDAKAFFIKVKVYLKKHL